jgi:diguanylate cyclase (GGDEF)-like protein
MMPPVPAGDDAPAQPDPRVRPLGDALASRVSDVLSRAAALTLAEGVDSQESLDAAVEQHFERIGQSSALALARWIAGGDPPTATETGHEAWHAYAQLAAQSAAPLDEVTKRCLHWRDAVDEVLSESAREMQLPVPALAKALSMTQRSLDVTLVRMCRAFEVERSRIEHELSRRQEELAFMATHDQLTGLPNRTLILDRGRQMLGRSRRLHTPVAALLIDLDNFTAINDTLGHAAGDELLQAIAGRLGGVLRDIDALGRVGGDEFVVLAEDVPTEAEAQIIVERLKQALKEPFVLADGGRVGLTITASIGAVTGERASMEDLLRDTDIAMHRAKWDGKNRCVIFQADMQHVVQSRMELEMDLHAALERGEFFLLYQPTLDLAGMAPSGFEALLRWTRPSQGIVQPMDFIPLLEETGLIVDVGRWVLGEACRQGARWRRSGHAVGMAVNVSARQLETDQFIDDVRHALAGSGLDPQALTLEITETALMRDPEETARRLRAIKDLRVRIAIDDFGTGYSSFGHLKRFPVDALKIDRSFIWQLAENPEGETLLRTLVKLGKALSMETVAEGIEHEHELSVLRDECCDSGQGYLFARPLDVHAAAAFLRDWQENGVLEMPGEAGGVGVPTGLERASAAIADEVPLLLAGPEGRQDAR